MKILLLQLFWVSFAIIGVAEFVVYARLVRHKGNKFITFLSNTHPLVVFIVALATGMSSFAFIVTPSCFLELPIVWVEIFYLLTLTASVIVLIRARELVKMQLSRIKVPSNGRLLLIIVIVTLIGDFRTSLQIGGLLTGDAKYELAQINLFAHKHLSLTDPVFGVNGEPMTIYSTSILHSIQAMASNFLHLSVARVWFYSNAFCRFIIWISLFALSWELLPQKVRRSWSYVVLILVPFLYGVNFIYAELHNTIVFAWTALFIIGIKIWLESRNIFLLLVATVLIATSHPLNSGMALGFLIILSIVLAFMRFMTKQRLISLVPIVLILLLPISIYLYYPHGITSAGFNDATTSGPQLQLIHYGPLLLNSLRLPFSFLTLVTYLILIGYLMFLKYIPNKKLRLIFLILLMLVILLVYNPILISLIGYIYLLVKAIGKKMRVAIGLLLIYLGLLLYNPILLYLIKGNLPLWTISRFQDFNLLTFMAPIIGILCLIVLPFEKYKYKRLALASPIAVVVIFLIILPAVFPLNVTSVFGLKETDYQRSNFNELKTLDDIAQFNTQLRNQIVFSDDIDLAIIPGAVVTNVFSIDNEANANSGIHIGQRIACSQKLVQTLNSSDLKASGINIIITHSPHNSHFVTLLNSESNIHLLRASNGYLVYRVDENAGIPKNPKSICAIPPTEK